MSRAPSSRSDRLASGPSGFNRRRFLRGLSAVRGAADVRVAGPLGACAGELTASAAAGQSIAGCCCRSGANGIRVFPQRCAFRQLVARKAREKILNSAATMQPLENVKQQFK